MSNFDRAVKALNDVDEAIDHLADNEAYVTALAAAGLLAPDVQIIRTVEDLEALDAETARVKAEQKYEQALAEETYFYGVQVWMGGRWIMMLTSNYGTSLMYRGKWFERKDEAEECAAKWNHDTPTRIVRQRRSPVEVINE